MERASSVDMDIIHLALACYRTPLAYQERFALHAPLPENIDQLLWLANGSPDVLNAAVARTGTKSQELRDAARFCIQRWCFARGADSHRVLGVQPGAPLERIKEHHRLLIRLFHPDRTAGREAWTDLYAARINEAWTALSRAPSPTAESSPHSPPPQPVLAGACSTAWPDRDSRRPHSPPPLHPSIRHAAKRKWLVPRRWLPSLVLSGLAVVVTFGLWGLYLSKQLTGHDPPVSVELPHLTDPVSAPVAADHPAGHSALATLLTAPDWQALEQQEQQVRQQVAQVRQERSQLEQNRREQVAMEEAQLARMQAERARLEAQLKIEQARVEQIKTERLTAERRRLEQLKAEQAQAEQVKAERWAAEQQRLEQLQTEQAKAERLAETLRAERQRLEQAKVEQVRAERAQAERQRLEKQVKQEQAKIESARLAAPSKIEPQRLAMETVANQASPVSPVVMTVPAPKEPQLTLNDLDQFVGYYTRAYERGDINGVMALFAPSARGKNASNRSQIRQDYATLFGAHTIRGLWLHDFRWSWHGESASGVGRYELRLKRRDNGELRQMDGNIRFTVQKHEDRVLIETIDYDWPGS